MWVFVHFDLPTEEKIDKKNYSSFRKFLLQDGFVMMQYSIYARHCSSRENAMVHKNRVKKMLPPLGNIVVFDITDAQFEQMEFFTGSKKVVSKNQPSVQLELF
jgi:CRISPR-associated protein Cas2